MSRPELARRSHIATTTIASRVFRLLYGALTSVVLLSCAFGTVYAEEQTGGVTLTGRVEQGSGVVYRLPDLQAGNTLYLYAKRTDGNLDPVLYVLPGDVDVETVGQQIMGAVHEADASGEDALAAFAAASDELTLAWDDDSGNGYDASLSLIIPQDADYVVVVDANRSLPTSGEFQLLAGLNMPEVAEGTAPSSQTLPIEHDDVAPVEAVQRITDTLTTDQSPKIYRLSQPKAGDTLTAVVEPTSGDLVPVLRLEDFGGKSLAADNLLGLRSSADITYTFDEDPNNYRLSVSAATRDGEQTEGTFRLLLGLNTTQELTQALGASGPAITYLPIPVHVVLKIDQITDVDQQAENFGVVANMRLDWHDPAFAFSPDSCRCDVKRFRSDRIINDYLTRNDINLFPSILLFNQQASRSTQSRMLLVAADGSVTYFERFAAVLQAPDFNFRQFPFDVQQFYVRVQSLFESEYFALIPDDVHSGFGEQLGEEEWIFTNDRFTSELLTVDDRPQLAFGFTTHRHLTFYIFRIFLPVLIIILISWITFFLHEYSRRIEVTSANLLIFIAYNFTIADDLPRIGYLTFLDVVLISTFVVSGLVLIINVWFRKLERTERVDVAKKWDRVLIWLYPFLYVTGGLIVVLVFFSSDWF